MGWSYHCDTNFKRADLIAKLTRHDAFAVGIEVLEHRAIGNNLWSLIKLPNGRITIALSLMRSGGRDSGWGHKDLSEDCGPVEVNCPLSFIERATPVDEDNRYAAEWRERVKHYHQVRKVMNSAKPAQGKAVKYGGHVYILNEPAGPRRGWMVTRQSDNRQFRMQAKQLAEALRASV